MYNRFFGKTINESYSFFLFGPRGTGKTSWLKEKIPNGLYIDLLNQETFFDLLKTPHKIESMIPTGFKEWIIIDEIQKIPVLLNEVHRLIEKNRYKFILTGSSSRSLKRQGTNLLAGRALYYKMFPLTAIELGTDFVLEKSLRYGHLPTIYSQSVNPEEYLQSYIHLYLKEEVMQEGLTRNAGAFARFLQVASFSQGSTVNTTEIAREVSIERKTVEDYFQITEDLLLATRVPVFTKKAKRKTITHSKFYYFDVGIYRSLRPMGPFDRPEEAEGPALESLVFQEIQAINSYFNFGYEIYFWRTVDKLEIDFILYGKNGIVGIEVKRSTKINSDDLKSLKIFQSDYPIAKLYLFYGGTQRLYFDQIEAIPITEALKNLPSILAQNDIRTNLNS